jgi:hypothetical protein
LLLSFATVLLVDVRRSGNLKVHISCIYWDGCTVVDCCFNYVPLIG